MRCYFVANCLGFVQTTGSYACCSDDTKMMLGRIVKVLTAPVRHISKGNQTECRAMFTHVPTEVLNLLLLNAYLSYKNTCMKSCVTKAMKSSDED